MARQRADMDKVDRRVVKDRNRRKMRISGRGVKALQSEKEARYTETSR